jgi:prepilin-type N-terminal cleavage/methylation domain-containing protein
MRASRRCGARGHSLPELLAAIAVFGVLIVMTAPLATYLLRHGSIEEVHDANFTVGFGLVPVVREDARRAIAARRRLLGLDGGRDGLTIDFGREASGARAVVYRVAPGEVRRVEYREVGGRLERAGEQTWRGSFAARFGIERPGSGTLVALEAEGLGPDGKLVSFRFGLRR